MLKLALEIPTSQLKRWSPLLDLDFILAHKVLNDKHYADFFASREKGREVILDNSTHEFGVPIPLDQLRLAAQLSRANFVIAPDIVTEEMSQEQYFKNLRWMQEAATALFGFNVAAVLCGRTTMERNAYTSRCVGRVKMLCFTFHDRRRFEWWEEFSCHAYSGYFPRIHVLGMASVDELKRWVDVSEKYPQYSFSFDTCKPLKWGVQGKRLDQIDGTVRGGSVKSKDVLEMTHFTDEQIQCIEENISYLRKVCRGEA